VHGYCAHVDSKLDSSVPRHARRRRTRRGPRLRGLLAHGIAVIARNFRCRAGELDLVCVDGGYLVVLEVRQRARMDFGGPLASIGAAKRERIRRATEFFRLGAGRWREHPVRFDVVGVVGAIGGAGALGGAAPPFIIWIKDAFRPA
jgi:putative endonuclease